MIIVYLSNYYISEEEILKLNGIPCIRFEYPFSDPDVPDNLRGKTIMIRGGKLEASAYKDVVQHFRRNGVTSIVDEGDYEKIGNAIEYSKCFGKFAPKVMMFNIGDSVASISNSLSVSGLKFPLFVRSDVESAAKYVGFDSCVLKSGDSNAIESVIQPIRDYVKNPSKIVMKEIVTTMKHNGKNIEYRAVVVSGKIICFDYELNGDVPEPSNLHCYAQFDECVSAAYSAGLHGAYFVDFGINSDGNLFVVECKNIINGTIKNVDSFMKGVKSINGI